MENFVKKFIVYVLIFLGLNLEVQAMPSQAAALPPGGLLTANFVQYRHLNGIPKPIKSEGHMILWDGKGLLWSIAAPFPHAILITKTGLYQVENKIKTTLVKAGDNSMFDVMAGIFNMQEGREIKGFTIEDVSASHNPWKIRLTPQHARVKSFIKSITVEGHAHITHITISRPSGDRDEIDVSGHAFAKSASPQMQELFDE